MNQNPEEIAERALNTGIDLTRTEWGVHLTTVVRLLAEHFPGDFAPRLTLPAPALCMSRAARVEVLSLRQSRRESLWCDQDRLPGMEGEQVVRIIHHDHRNGSDRIGQVTTIKEFNHADDNEDERRIA